MDRIFKSMYFNNVLLSCVLIAFSLAVITPPPAYAQVNLNDVNFGIRIQKLKGQVWKYKNKLDSNKLLDTVLEIRSEIEAYTGHKFNLDKELDRIEKESKKKGSKVSKTEFNRVRKLIKSEEKKKHKRAAYIASYLDEAPSISFDEYEELCLAAAHGQNQGQAQEEIPIKLFIAITLLLGGSFLMFAAPICPIVALPGETMMGLGFGMLLDQGIDKFQGRISKTASIKE
ncbi:MAG: hypothetical protein CK425_06945 [Parachlamydia sp.]|nr:MAG: hypothetical protein CK425_06945 [Parachlamydia sp.]